MSAPPGVADVQRRPRTPRSVTPFKAVSALVAVFLAWLAIFPLAGVAARVFVTDGRLSLAPLARTFALPDLGALVLNTVVVVVASSAVALLIGSVLAWLNERTDARMGTLTDAMPMVPFLMPPIAGAVGWVLLLSPGAGFLNVLARLGLDRLGLALEAGPLSIYSWYGLIWVYTIYQVPYVFMLVSAGLRNVDPGLEEASRIGGAGPLRTMRRVTLPNVAPSLAGATLLMVWSGFGLFSIPTIIGTGANIDVLSVRIVNLLSFTYPPQTGVAVGLSIIVVAFVAVSWYAQTWILRRGRHSTLGGKGFRPSRTRLGRWRWPARLLVLGYIAVTTVLPFAGLVLVSLNGYWTANIQWTSLNLDAVRAAVVDDFATRDALLNSLSLGVGGATVAVVAAATVALFVSRAGRVGRVLDGAIKLPATFSHIVIAVGFVLVFAGPPFNLGGTLVILLLAYLALYMPQGAVSADAAVGQVGRELPEASHLSGAGGGRTFRRVFLPLMLPGLVTGWALLFVRMAGDLTASAILAGTENSVVGFRILEIYLNGSYAELAALATVLTLISCVVVVFVLVFARRRAKWSAPTTGVN